MQQNPTIFSMETEVLDSVSLSGRVEPVSWERRIHLPEVRSKQVLPPDVPSFARVRQLRFSSFTDSQYGFRAYAFAAAQMVCDDIQST